MHESEKWKWSRSVVSDSSRTHGLQPTRLLCSWDFPGKSTGVGCHCLLRSNNYFPSFFFLFFKFIYFNWRLITLWYCGGFAIHWHESAMGVHVFPILNLTLHPIPLGHPSAPALSTLSHASNLDWWSVSYMIIYMLQWYALTSSHPHLLPQSPKDCSIYLCLFCCLAYRVIITIFLNSIYMH